MQIVIAVAGTVTVVPVGQLRSHLRKNALQDAAVDRVVIVLLMKYVMFGTVPAQADTVAERQIVKVQM